MVTATRSTSVSTEQIVNSPLTNLPTSMPHQPNSISYLLPRDSKLFFLIPLGYVLTLAYANVYYINDLLESHELSSPKTRNLVTISAVFTYKFELRWMFYYSTLVWAIIFGGHAPQMFVRYFTEDPILLASIKRDNKSRITKHIQIFEVSMILHTFFNASLVYLIRGEYPASTAVIPEKS